MTTLRSKLEDMEAERRGFEQRVHAAEASKAEAERELALQKALVTRANKEEGRGEMRVETKSIAVGTPPVVQSDAILQVGSRCAELRQRCGMREAIDSDEERR
eukprot:Sspe_Gene.48796::Locus_25714_Transcript_2_3_Confidence_0.714_Length_681::g.48796::m.48796